MIIPLLYYGRNIQPLLSLYPHLSACMNIEGTTYIKLSCVSEAPLMARIQCSKGMLFF